MRSALARFFSPEEEKSQVRAYSLITVGAACCEERARYSRLSFSWTSPAIFSMVLESSVVP